MNHECWRGGFIDSRNKRAQSRGLLGTILGGPFSALAWGNNRYRDRSGVWLGSVASDRRFEALRSPQSHPIA
jgi:hypothetical protein